ncbi:SEL1-like repeat protein [Marilutibacter spongiae]|uniref:SEL1-like repeat protein n=1 Tax=Marilutibacter spongiae TaxID=2025720 RepID=A0A7W3Y782_9GAMM|nr:SEL1-like repeat protein [Lysobacter spongiae]MBB1062027.1 SEL1-like repeat protein [Lysobacter spongiae]
MRRPPQALALAVAMLALLSVPPLAARPHASPDASADARNRLAPQLMELSLNQLDQAASMAADHPNELWRARALRSLKLERPERAVEQFRTAARYADKFSQHSLSLMYWHGVGVPADRALAYVWSDLAAERGYEDLLRVREKMWLSLDAAERQRALGIGPAMYARYGDDVARPRTDWAIRRALADATGSRVGATADRIEIVAPTQGHARMSARTDTPRGSEYYAAHRWSTERYWQAEDRKWNGRVIVLPLETVDAAPADGHPD